MLKYTLDYNKPPLIPLSRLYLLEEAPAPVQEREDIPTYTTHTQRGGFFIKYERACVKILALAALAGLLLLSPARAHGAGFSISGSTFTLASSVKLNVNGNITVNNGELLANNATQIQIVGDVVLNGGLLGVTNAAQILLGGNWTNSGGAFAAGTSTVTFTGNAPTLTGSTTFYDLAYSVGGGAMTFVAGATQTVQGLLTFQGASASSPVTLTPSPAGSEWYLNNSGTNNVSYVNVNRSDARAGVRINALNSIDSGNNYNWFFGNLNAPGIPMRVGGLRYTLQHVGDTSTSILFAWNPVLYDTNGNAYSSSQAPSYLILTSNSIPTDSSDWSGAATVTSTGTILSLTNGALTYVAVRAVGTGGQSNISMIFKWPAQTVFSPSTDPVSRYELNSLANRNLYTLPDGSGRRNWVLLLKQRNDLLGAGVVKSIEVDCVDADSGLTTSGYFDSTGGGTLYVGYSVQGGVIVQGSPMMAQNAPPLIPASQAKNLLSLFWFNGVDWIKMGGQVDTNNSQITFQTGRGGLFQIRQAAQSGNAAFVQVYPRIITPNGDGLNDVAIFQFGEGNLLGSDVTGEIFNIRGAKVADLKPGPDPATTLLWDGKDSDGRTVLSGIYIYQIKIGGNRTNGTIVVAR
jgi:hypothetical protein